MASRRSGLILQRNGLTFAGTGPEQPIVENKKLYLKGGQTLVERKVDSQGRSIISVQGISDDPSKSLELNLDDITTTLTELKVNQARFIKALDENLKGKFETIVNIINALYETPAYDFIHERIAKVFSDIKIATPGTVGAYFTGCMLSTNFNGNPGCSAVCASGVPPPKSASTWPFCDKLTILYDSDRVFHTLNTVNNASEAFVFMPDNLPFKGFTQAEASQLRALGITKVKLTRYASNGTQYQDIINDFVDLNQTVLQENGTKSNDPEPKSTNPKSTDSTATNAAVVILIILLILLILAIIWQVYQRRN